jgi:hypothetical protein
MAARLVAAADGYVNQSWAVRPIKAGTSNAAAVGMNNLAVSYERVPVNEARAHRDEFERTFAGGNQVLNELLVGRVRRGHVLGEDRQQICELIKQRIRMPQITVWNA